MPANETGTEIGLRQPYPGLRPFEPDEALKLHGARLTPRSCCGGFLRIDSSRLWAIREAASLHWCERGCSRRFIGTADRRDVAMADLHHAPGDVR